MQPKPKRGMSTQTVTGPSGMPSGASKTGYPSSSRQAALGPVSAPPVLQAAPLAPPEPTASREDQLLPSEAGQPPIVAAMPLPPPMTVAPPMFLPFPAIVKPAVPMAVHSRLYPAYEQPMELHDPEQGRLPEEGRWEELSSELSTSFDPEQPSEQPSEQLPEQQWEPAGEPWEPAEEQYAPDGYEQTAPQTGLDEALDEALDESYDNYEYPYDYDYTEEQAYYPETEEPSAEAARVRFEPSPPPDESATSTDSSPAPLQRKHLQVWERFFENAFARKQTQTAAATARVSWSSSIAKKFFTSAICTSSGVLVVEGWKVLQSGAKYQILLRLAQTTQTYRHLSWYAAIITGDLTSLLALLDDEAVVDDMGRSLLHYACKYNQLSILEVLFDGNLDIDLPDLNGHTALHVAVAFNHPKIIRFLLDCAADVSLQDGSGQTALDIAQAMGHTDAAQMITDHMAGKIAEVPTVAERRLAATAQPADELLHSLKKQYQLLPSPSDPPSPIAQETQGDASEEEEEEEEESIATMISDRLAEKIWMFTTWLIELTMGMLFGVSKVKRKKLIEEEESVQYTPLLPRPPTDSELTQVPYMEPPKDVMLAVAMAKAQAQKDGENQYSLGNSMPPGTKWRYVPYNPTTP